MGNVDQYNVSNWILSYQNRLSEETLMKDAFYNFVDEPTLEPWELIDQTFVKEDPCRDHVTFQDKFYLGEA